MALPRFWYTLLQPQTVYDCCAFLNTPQFVMCCSGIWYRDKRFIFNRWTRLYALSLPTLLISSLVYIIRTKAHDPTQQVRIVRLDRLLLSIVILELFMSTYVFISTVVSMQRTASRYASFFDRLFVLDQRLQREFGAQLNYHKLLRKNIVVVSLIVVAYVSAVCSGIVQMAYNDFWMIFAGAWCYTVITGGPHLTGYVHMNLAELLTIRFRLLQQLLQRHYLLKHFPQTKLREQRIQSAVEMVKELFRLVDDINVVFRSTLLSSRLHDFTLTTSELYVIFGRNMAGGSGFGGGARLLLYVVMSMLPPFYKMSVAPVYCDKALREGRKCLHIIEQVDNWSPQSAEMRTLVASMMFWCLENRTQFSSGLNMPVSKANMTIVASVIMNYLLILIQFQMTEEMGDQIEQQKNVLQEWIGGIE